MKPEELAAFLDSPAAQEILGFPCFLFIREAEIWRMTGTPIRRRAESEQAFFITLMLKLNAEHGDRWRDVFTAELQSRIEKINADRETALANLNAERAGSQAQLQPHIIDKITGSPPAEARELSPRPGAVGAALAGDAAAHDAKEPAFFAEIAPGVIGPGPDWRRDPRGTWLRLAMVSVEMSEEAVAAWSDEQLQLADCYCMSVHLSAGDHDDVIVPPRPDFIPAPSSPALQEGSILPEVKS